MVKMIELPYPLNALEPYYSKETLDLHYNVLYKGYVDNTNKTQEKLQLARKKDDFEKHKNKYEETFKKYKITNVVDAKHFLKKEGYEVKKDINMLLLDSEIKDVDIKVTYLSDALNRAGYVEVSLKGKVYIKENIYKREKEKSILTRIRDFFKLF